MLSGTCVANIKRSSSTKTGAGVVVDLLGTSFCVTAVDCPVGRTLFISGEGGVADISLRGCAGAFRLKILILDIGEAGVRASL